MYILFSFKSEIISGQNAVSYSALAINEEFPGTETEKMVGQSSYLDLESGYSYVRIDCRDGSPDIIQKALDATQGEKELKLRRIPYEGRDYYLGIYEYSIISRFKGHLSHLQPQPDKGISQAAVAAEHSDFREQKKNKEPQQISQSVYFRL